MKKQMLAVASLFATVATYAAELPSGYVQLEYIESTGSQYIDSEYVFDYTCRAELDFQMTDTKGQQYLFGASANALSVSTYINGSAASGGKFTYTCNNDANSNIASTMVVDKKRHTLVIDSLGGKFKIDTAISMAMTSTRTKTSEFPLAIFSTRMAVGTANADAKGIRTDKLASMRLYSFKIYKNNELECDFIPCVNVGANVAGLYDLQRNAFYSSEGTSQFVFPYPDAGSYTFTGGAGTGDLSDALNWDGNRLPNLFDNATVDGKTAGRNDFTRSGVFGVKALSFLNWTNGMLLDLNNGSISAQTLTIGGAGPVVVSNGTVDVSGRVKVNASSVMTVAEGATINTPDSVAVDAELLVDKNGKLVIDGGAYNAPCTTGNGYGKGNTFGDQNYGGSPGYLEVKNGGSYSVPSVGRAQVTTFANSKIIVTDDSTFDISKGNNYSFSLGTVQHDNVYAVTNSVFKWFKWRVGYIGTTGVAASNSRFYFHDSTVSSSQPLSDNYNWGVGIHSGSTGNQWLLDGTDNKSSFSTKFDGTKNSITVKDGEHSGQILLQNGTGNSFTLDGATYTSGCSLSLNGGRENVFCVKNGATVSPALNPTIGGVSNRLEISGSKFGASEQTINYTFNGEAFQYRLLDNAEGHIGQWGDNPALTFGSKAKDTLISIDNSTLVTEGYVDLSSAGLPSGIVFEFRGESPRWTPTYWQYCRRSLVTVGAADDANADTAPRIRFVLPETPYAKAPLDVDSKNFGWYGIQLNPTTKLEFDFSQIGKHKQRRVYPLISGACRGSGDLITSPLTKEIVDQIAANSNLPEGCTLVYSDWVLSLKVRGTAGLMLVIR